MQTRRDMGVTAQAGASTRRAMEAAAAPDFEEVAEVPGPALQMPLPVAPIHRHCRGHGATASADLVVWRLDPVLIRGQTDTSGENQEQPYVKSGFFEAVWRKSLDKTLVESF